MFHLLLIFITMGSAFLVLMMLVMFSMLTIISYFFESIGIMNISKKEGFKYSFISWIPGIAYYILGKYCTDGNDVSKVRNGIVYSCLTIIKIALIIIIFKTKMIIDSQIFLIFVILYFIVYCIVDIIYINKFYKKIYKNYKIYTIATILTIGLIKPIFIFLSKKKLK